MTPYLNSLKDILENGEERIDRTGVGTRSKFGLQARYDLRKGFPAVTTKKLAFNAVISELLWFIEGSQDERRLAEILYGTCDNSKKTIWTENAQSSYWKSKATFEGDVGRIYGVQWRSWGPRLGERVDQLKALIHDLKSNPFSRRHILTAWNPGEIDNMALPPCHILSQFYVNSANELSCQMYQRSADYPLGVPFNIASYALLTHMIAQVCGLKIGEFIHTVGDGHIYLNQIDGVKEQLTRQPLALPTLKLNQHVRNIDDFKMSDFEILNYQHHKPIKFPFAV
jgi:thymidylate synthase